MRVYDEEHERRLVAVVELVSPGNKERPESRRAFVAKRAALLRQHVSVAIVDVVTIRSFNLYAELLAFIGQILRHALARHCSLFCERAHFFA